MSKRDYYQVLGIEKSADKKEIKKAYRKLAKQYHPDRNQSADAEGKFKEVQEAYDVLSDDQKRSAYDQYGFAGTQGFSGGGYGQGFGGFDFNGMGGLGDIFEQFFGNGFGFSSSGFSRRQKRGADIELNMKLSFEEAVFGARKKVKYKRYLPCEKCSGTGAEGGDMEQCSTCGGHGQVMRMQRTVFGQIQTASVCPDCGGDGNVAEHKCGKCGGDGRNQIVDEFELKVPAAIPDGVTMRLSGRGHAGKNAGDFGDLFVNIEVAEHKQLERRGDDIYLDWELDLVTAVLGGEIEIPTVHGATRIKVPAGTQPEQVLRLTGKGGPKFKKPDENGNQYIRFKLVVPQKLTRKQKDLWQQLQALSPSE